MLPACLQVFGCVNMRDFLAALAARRLKPNATSMDIYRRLYAPPPEVAPSPAGSPLQTKVGVRMRATAADGSCLRHAVWDQPHMRPGRLLAAAWPSQSCAPRSLQVLFKHIQGLLQPSTMLLGETGDAIFNCQKLALPDGCRYDWSQQYGSIGWSVGATLGLAMAGRDAGRRVLACIGDGSFQMTAQASELLRCRRDEATCQKGLALLTGALRGGHAVPAVLTWC